MLRFYGLNNQSLWNDELSSWYRSSHESITEVIKLGVIPDVHPPGYQIILYYVERIFGDSEEMLRFPSVAAGVISIFMIYPVTVPGASRISKGIFSSYFAPQPFRNQQMHIPFPSKPYQWALLLVTLFGVAIRAIGSAVTPLWVDEALTEVISKWSIVDLWSKSVDPTPPIYYTLYKLLIPEPASPLMARSISLVFGSLSIPLIYKLGREVGGLRVGFFAACLLSVWHPHIIYSQENRAYALLFFNVLAASYFLSLYFNASFSSNFRKANHCLLASLFFLVISIYTHYSSLFLMALVETLALGFLAREFAKGNRKNFAVQASLHLLAALALIPAAYFILIQADQFSWLPHYSIFKSLTTMEALYFPSIFKSPLSYIFIIMVAGGAVAAYRHYKTAFFIIILFFLFPVLLWFVGFIKPVFMFKTALISIIGAILAVSIFICGIKNNKIRALAAIFVVSAYTVSAVDRQIQEYTFQLPQAWRTSAQILADNVDSNDSILLCVPFIYPAFRREFDARRISGIYWPRRNEGYWYLNQLEGVDTGGSWGERYFSTILKKTKPLERREVSNVISHGMVWGVLSHCGGQRRELWDQMLDDNQLESELFWSGPGVEIQRIIHP